MRNPFRYVAVLLAAMLVGCASSKPPQTPFPAFVVSDELPDVFLAELPGIRAKRYVSDATTRSGSYRIDLPASWQGTSAASPGKSLEILVLAGELSIADVDLKAGGYAYLPPGTLGFNLKSSGGARVLYFLDDVDTQAKIRAPLILDSGLLDWQPTATDGMSTKELRNDPGSGARAWLVRLEPGTSLPWEVSTATREGYLVEGSLMHSECVAGVPQTGSYMTGGYVFRSPGIINGGPEAVVGSRSVWFYRELSASRISTVPGCVIRSFGD